ncbi:MAG: hypothetical protein RMK18_12290 [Armatimonadota bacterium]|nr:hypothetical protein [Armatimonadota bacterium]MDW8026625.1 hypothetical protein [Armatimonadota bacterium]
MAKLNGLMLSAIHLYFRKVAPSLFHSAAIQALTKYSQAEISGIPSIAEAKAFLEQAQRRQRIVTELETNHIRKNQSAVGFCNIIKLRSTKLKAAPATHINAYRR